MTEFLLTTVMVGRQFSFEDEVKRAYLDGLAEGRKETTEKISALEKENEQLKEEIADLQKYIETLSENYENEIAEHKKVIVK